MIHTQPTRREVSVAIAKAVARQHRRVAVLKAYEEERRAMRKSVREKLEREEGPQWERALKVLRRVPKGKWVSISEIADILATSPRNASARIRDLRRPEYGSNEIEHRYRSGVPAQHASEYRLVERMVSEEDITKNDLIEEVCEEVGRRPAKIRKVVEIALGRNPTPEKVKEIKEALSQRPHS